MKKIAINDIHLNEEFDTFMAADELSKKEQRIYRTLGDSILNMGLINPLLVQRIGNQIHLIDGYKRLRIIKELLQMKKTVPGMMDGLVDIEYISDSLDPTVARFMCSSREQMQYTETAKNMDELLKVYSVTRNELAHKSGQQKYVLSRYGRFNRMIESMCKAIQDCKIPFDATKFIILFTEEGQKVLYKKLMKYTTITKAIVEKVAYAMPEKYFVKSKEERLAISKIGAGHKANNKPIFNSKVEKRILNEQLSEKIAERDILYKERERYIDSLGEITGMFEIALRHTAIKEYLRKKHTHIFEGLCTVIKSEFNKDIA